MDRSLRMHRSLSLYLAAVGIPAALASCSRTIQPTADTTSAPTATDPLLDASRAPQPPSAPAALARPPASASGGPNTQPSSSPPYDSTRFSSPPSPGGGFCGRTQCESEPASEPAQPAPAPFQRCEARSRGLAEFSAYHTAESRNGGARASCCYLSWGSCGGKMGGRAFRPGGDEITAPTCERGDWAGEAPEVLRAGPERAARLARAWAEDAAFEHASVASFARFALQLLALGAPLDLVADAHRAALDEVEHARAAYALASAHAGEALGPGPLRWSGPTAPADVASFVRETIVDGCVGESVAAQVAFELAERADDPAARAFHRRVAQDEEQHAALAFRAVAWAVRALGDEARGEARRALGALQEEPAREADGGPDEPWLALRGRAGPALRLRLGRQTVRLVVIPCLGALLEAVDAAQINGFSIDTMPQPARAPGR